ncbi:two-component regulator propeller domain-containing protein [candidate division KSB1 bacterium]
MKLSGMYKKIVRPGIVLTALLGPAVFIPGCGDSNGPGEGLFTNYTTSNGLMDDKILCMTYGPDNRVYVGSYNGLSMFDGSDWSHLSGADGLPGDVVVGVAVSDSGGIWVSGFDLDDANQGKIGYFVDGEWEIFPVFNNLIHSIVSDDRQNIYWFFSEDGVTWCDGVNWGKSSSNFFGIDSSEIRVVRADGFENFWLGTRDGVYRYDWTEFDHFTKTDGILDNVVTAIAEGGPNELWVGTTLGPSLYSNQTWEAFPNIGLAQKSITAIAVDGEKGIWVGTTTGVSRYYQNTWAAYTSENGLVNNRVTAMVSDHLGNVWIGTQGGISVYQSP